MPKPLPIELVKVQLYASPRSSFVIGLSRLGESTLGGSGPSWHDLQADITSMSLARGGSIKGASTTLDVGLLTVMVKNIADPVAGAYFTIPNLPVRVLGPGDEELFTGRLATAKTRYLKDREDVLVTLVAVDQPDVLAGPADLSGPQPLGIDQTTWWRAVDNLLGETGLEYDRSGDWYDPSLVESLSYPQWGPTATGWSRFGDGPGDELALTATSPTVGPVTMYSSPTYGAIDYVAYGSGAQYTLSGLVPGETYAVAVKLLYNTEYRQHPDEWRSYAVGVDGSWGTPVVVGKAENYTADYTVARHTFKATASTAVLQIARTWEGRLDAGDDPAVTTRPEFLRIVSVERWRINKAGESRSQLQLTVRSATIADYLRMFCDSARVDWWIDPAGIIRFKPRAGIAAAAFILSDVRDPGHVNYVDLAGSFDSAEAVNTLDLANHAISWSPGPQGKPTDTVYPVTVANTASQALYGRRTDSLDVNLPQFAIEAYPLDNPFPDFVVESVTVDVLAYPAIATVDLFTGLEVRFRDFRPTPYQVVGLQHTVTPTTWRITLTLRKDTTA